ncbi:GATA transcription factor (Ams2) [Ophiocordyceps camponoti-floridani]|uniref:GATA transcription factor (Ams2) n=1 Tax=Ophiocordyceps camponoti-floridani TaxID=2030778 RepID=A0A8H4Q4B4_9HYPO|nr:GATA transcription factor (Ams2) [Ophiocordyceps camponoti-floridani]KAF4584504.1 GATA transcription factor (Ams2) [Ophiocordyceps camponoti-floridani]
MAKPRPLDDHKMPALPPPAGPQYRPMGLKVHYTFDKNARINCLARHPQVLRLQAISIDDVTTIGIVDLRACLDAIIECSPELASGQSDFSIYTVDYSEPDTPFVGQGLLSWALDSMRPDAVHRPPKLVVGRVAKSLLAVFNAGSQETLEVKIRFFESAPTQRGNRHGSVDFQQCQPFDRPTDKPQSEFAATPSAASDWNPFSHNDNQTVQAASESRVPSRAQSPGHMVRANSLESSGGPLVSQPGVVPPQSTSMGSQPDMAQPQPRAVNGEAQHVDSTPIDAPEEATRASEAPSQASSQASTRGNRKRSAVPGRGRGRPRKKPAASDGPSGHDETTEGEDGPTRKRAKVTKAGKSAVNPFASEPESLRVAASTSSSLRSFRPVASGSNDGATAGDAQEAPRAPTPIPRGASVARQPAREPVLSRLRQESLPAQQTPTALYSDSRLQPLSPSQEYGRSPDSLGPTPAYSEDSIASSPPVQPATSFMRSSPPPSSPVLPPMPSTELQLDDCGFANDDDMDDLFGEEPPQPEQPVTAPTCDGLEKSGTTNTLGVPTPFQVFQMQDESNSNDPILLHSQNDASEPTPASTKQQPVVSKESMSLPRLERDLSHKQARLGSCRPTMEPTPPPTTDAVEKPTSPGPGPEPSTVPAQADDQSCTAPAPDSAEESSSSSIKKAEASKSPAQQPSMPKPSFKRAFQASKCKSVRSLMRSQSAGEAALALPSTPASEPAGPLSTSQSTAATTAMPGQNRSVSSGPLILPVPASDPVRPSTQLDEVESRELSMAPTDITAPPSPPARSNKNMVKKQAIKQRLEEAILNGEMPPFCSNCGAIETPTWRKIWVQDCDGVPKYCEYSEKPGRVTAIEIMTRDAEEKPTSYRLVKKSLGPDDDKTAWKELLLCNPCGIWLTKCKCHRPPDRWDKDLTRVGQERRRKTTTGATNGPRPRKSRAKSDAAANPTSDAHPVADALGIIDVTSPKAPGLSHSNGNAEQQSRQPAAVVGSTPAPVRPRGSGTAMSPVRLDFDEAVGSTKRLLFPSPRKEGVAKVLGEMEVNKAEGNKVPPALEDSQTSKGGSDDKENAAAEGENDGRDDVDASETLNSPRIARPSTPPPDANKMTSPFKTPTRVPGSHRPVTRSVSRSLRSNRTAVSPVQAQHTPTKTAAQNSFAFPDSPIFSRRSPRNHQGPLDGCDTPISRTISQMFSDPANFGLVDDMDLVTLPALDADSNQFDFDNLMSTDGVMAPSSPLRGDSLGFDYLNSANIWGQWTLDNSGDVSMSEG